MPEISTLRKPAPALPPSGTDSLLIRERYLRQRNRRSHVNDRAFAALWLAIAALVAWIFVVGFAALAH